MFWDNGKPAWVRSLYFPLRTLGQRWLCDIVTFRHQLSPLLVALFLPSLWLMREEEPAAFSHTRSFIIRKWWRRCVLGICGSASCCGWGRWGLLEAGLRTAQPMQRASTDVLYVTSFPPQQTWLNKLSALNSSSSCQSHSQGEQGLASSNTFSAATLLGVYVCVCGLPSVEHVVSRCVQHTKINFEGSATFWI